MALLAALPLGATERSKTVLAIYDQERLLPPNIVVDTVLRESLGLETDNPPTYLSEFLDVSRFGSSAYDKLLSDFFRGKYAGQHIDVILAGGSLALQFLARHQADLFTGIPVVFCGVSREFFESQTLPPNFVGVPIAVEPLPTFELALRLQPDAREIVIVTGTSEVDRMWEARLRRDLSHLQTSVPIRYLSGLALDDVLRELSRLAPNTIVYSLGLLRDGAGRTYIPRKVLRRMADASTAPIYGFMSTDLGSGIVGGYMFTMEDLGRQAAGLVQRILDGEKLNQADVPRTPPSRYVFDWKQLQRWHIPEKKLPPGSIVLYRELSTWQRYKQYIIGVIFVLLAETMLVFGLLWQRARRRKVEDSLVERLAFEKMLSDLSAAFINLPEEQVGATMQESLGRIAEFLKLSRITLFDYSQESRELTVAFSWCGKGVENPPAVTRINQLPWFSDRLLRGDSILLSDLNSIPEKASVERDYLTRMGAVSVAAIPLKAGDEFFGCISYVSTKRQVLWTDGLVEQLKLLAEVFSNALVRQRALDARLRHAAIVDSSDDAIVSKNLNGIIVSWNAAAQRLFGYSAAEAIGRPITILIPRELRDEQHLFHQRLMDGEHVQRYETVRVVKGGKKLAVALTISPVRDSTGNLVGFSEIARDITDRKRAEHVLRGSEERFRLVANSAPVLIWMSGTDKLCNFFNQGWLSFTGRSMAEELGERWASGVHPDDLENCLKIYSASFDARVDFEMEYRLRRFDGEYRWIVDFGVPRFESDGTFCGYIGSCIDITERKSAAESLQNLTGRLIRAQEEERSRIARDLHDDFSQTLALQCIDLEQLLKKLGRTETSDRTRILKMLKRTKQMTMDIRALSHQLHSNKLEYVGLLPAVSGLCEEISEKCEIRVHFTECGLPQNIPKDVALCLFRVAQEALANVVKHSHAKTAEVQLGANSNGVSLRIADDGKGIIPHDTNRGGGLGLVGMTERLRLVGGRLSVESDPIHGTTILAEVPMSAFPTKGQVRTVAAGGTES
jgi:PAS domain S-box-containing protein